MIGLFELLLLRVALWVVPPLLLVVLAIGPARVGRWCKQSWRWLWERCEDPEQILAEVVGQHEAHIGALREALRQAEKTEIDIVRNIQKSEKDMPELEAEARRLTAKGDDLGARAALYKLNLEQAAVDSFKQHLAHQREHIAESRRRLYLLELQLRQFEVGRSILLSQLAEAKTLEQQYAIANQFDPFSAVANWVKAEGLVQEKAINARAAERVHADTSDVATPSATPQVDSVMLDAQLAELKARLQQNNPTANHLRGQGKQSGEQPQGNQDLDRQRDKLPES